MRNQRYPHDEEALRRISAADEALAKSVRRKEQFRAAWAYVDAAAQGGDKAAQDLVRLVDGGVQ